MDVMQLNYPQFMPEMSNGQDVSIAVEIFAAAVITYINLCYILQTPNHFLMLCCWC